jgi:hypothetical protein
VRLKLSTNENRASGANEQHIVWLATNEHFAFAATNEDKASSFLGTGDQWGELLHGLPEDQADGRVSLHQAAFPCQDQGTGDSFFSKTHKQITDTVPEEYQGPQNWNFFGLWNGN